MGEFSILAVFIFLGLAFLAQALNSAIGGDAREFRAILSDAPDSVFRRCQQALGSNPFSKASPEGFLDVKANPALLCVEAKYKVEKVKYGFGVVLEGQILITLAKRADETEMIAKAMRPELSFRYQTDSSKIVLAAFRQRFV